MLTASLCADAYTELNDFLIGDNEKIFLAEGKRCWGKLEKFRKLSRNHKGKSVRGEISQRAFSFSSTDFPHLPF